MNDSTTVISVFEIILILVILSIQFYVAYTTIKKIQVFKNFLGDKDNLKLTKYYLNQDELLTVKASDITETTKYTIPNRLDNINDPIYKRGSITIDDKVYFGEVSSSEEDARYILTPTDYTSATFVPIVDSTAMKQQLLVMRDNACTYDVSFGDMEDVSIEKNGKVELQADGRWLVVEKCRLKVTKIKKETGPKVTMLDDEYEDD